MCSANAPKIDRTKMSVELLFDGANGNVANRIIEDLDWSRVFKLQPDACVLGECECVLRACGCDDCETHRDECRSDFLDELAFTSGAFVAIYTCTHAPRCRACNASQSQMHALSVARDAEAEGKSDDEIVACLESEGWQVYKFELHEGDLFLVPRHWECDDRGAWHPPVDEIVERVVASGDVEIAAEWEHCSVEGFAGDAEAIAWVREQIATGNVWGWAQVKVTVAARHDVASDYLGACSYEDEKAFRAGDYFRDMVRTCVEELLERGAFDHSEW